MKVMYCSNCGAEQKSQTYCRQCGKWIGSAPPEERMTVMIVFNALSAVFSLAAAIALFLTYFGEPGAKWSVYVAATFCLIISVYQALSFFFALNLRSRLKEGQKTSDAIAGNRVGELPAGDTNEFIGARSVTENTTELLERKP